MDNLDGYGSQIASSSSLALSTLSMNNVAGPALVFPTLAMQDLTSLPFRPVNEAERKGHEGGRGIYRPIPSPGDMTPIGSEYSSGSSHKSSSWISRLSSLFSSGPLSSSHGGSSSRSIPEGVPAGILTPTDLDFFPDVLRDRSERDRSGISGISGTTSLPSTPALGLFTAPSLPAQIGGVTNAIADANSEEVSTTPVKNNYHFHGPLPNTPGLDTLNYASSGSSSPAIFYPPSYPTSLFPIPLELDTAHSSGKSTPNSNYEFEGPTSPRSPRYGVAGLSSSYNGNFAPANVNEISPVLDPFAYTSGSSSRYSGRSGYKPNSGQDTPARYADIARESPSSPRSPRPGAADSNVWSTDSQNIVPAHPAVSPATAPNPWLVLTPDPTPDSSRPLYVPNSGLDTSPRFSDADKNPVSLTRTHTPAELGPGKVHWDFTPVQEVATAPAPAPPTRQGLYSSGLAPHTPSSIESEIEYDDPASYVTNSPVRTPTRVYVSPAVRNRNFAPIAQPQAVASPSAPQAPTTLPSSRFGVNTPASNLDPCRQELPIWYKGYDGRKGNVKAAKSSSGLIEAANSPLIAAVAAVDYDVGSEIHSVPAAGVIPASGSGLNTLNDGTDSALPWSNVLNWLRKVSYESGTQSAPASSVSEGSGFNIPVDQYRSGTHSARGRAYKDRGADSSAITRHAAGIVPPREPEEDTPPRTPTSTASNIDWPANALEQVPYYPGAQSAFAGRSSNTPMNLLEIGSEPDSYSPRTSLPTGTMAKLEEELTRWSSSLPNLNAVEPENPEPLAGLESTLAPLPERVLPPVSRADTTAANYGLVSILGPAPGNDPSKVFAALATDPAFLGTNAESIPRPVEFSNQPPPGTTFEDNVVPHRYPVMETDREEVLEELGRDDGSLGQTRWGKEAARYRGRPLYIDEREWPDETEDGRREGQAWRSHPTYRESLYYDVRDSPDDTPAGRAEGWAWNEAWSTFLTLAFPCTLMCY